MVDGNATVQQEEFAAAHDAQETTVQQVAAGEQAAADEQAATETQTAANEQAATDMTGTGAELLYWIVLDSHRIASNRIASNHIASNRIACIVLYLSLIHI